MKFAVIIEYGPDTSKIKPAYQAHREYLRQFLTNGQLRAAGPLAKDMGAVWIMDADNEEAINEIVKGEPFVAAGVIVSWEVHALAYWSAQEAKGEK